MKKLLHLIPVILVIVILGTTALSGCITIHIPNNSKTSSSTPPPSSLSAGLLSEVTMCKSYDSKTLQPIDKTSVFSSDSPAVYCTFKVSNAPSGTEVKVRWFYVKGDQKDLENSMVHEDADKFSGTQAGFFGLKMPSSGFPRGDYAVKLLVSGKELLSVPFSVQGSTAAPATTGKFTLPNLFQDPEFPATVGYPADWTYNKVSKTMVQFFGKQGTPAYNAVVTIQYVASTKAGGLYDSMDAVMKEFKKQILAIDSAAKITDNPDVHIVLPDLKTYSCKMYLAEFATKGVKYKQSTVIIPSVVGDIFSSFMVTMPVEISETYLPVVLAMLESYRVLK